MRQFRLNMVLALGIKGFHCHIKQL